MSVKSKMLFVGAAFSWLMVFLSWRFDHGLIIIADWAIFASGLSAWYGFILQKKKSRIFIRRNELESSR